ncbi:hypothetical protein JCM21714_4385 [Gracilibacillus boraciitolerans JCM 21714]|uniref:DUF58 domain-containing protein n=1 Tax=Gracilibacillus boraciitolerans JCM 21714 TaxID=1298598 RepID=W4VPS2_9BACI|nr:DUF58 domain-containing protein [Gracilibacillus boraciitolerans]GAE95171.1 hypothetical protein JCM21714_4385 [Gracilibacillus boraciitolerans JCM 21714]
MNIAWVIVVLLIIIFMQGIIYSKFGLKGITYKRAFSQDTVFEGGETIEMVDEIANKKLLPIPWIRLESKMSPHLLTHSENAQDKEEGEIFHRTLFSLLPYQKITRRHQLIGSKRGYYPLNTVSVTTGDGIGFGEVFDSFEASTAVTVYPAIVPLEEIPLPSHSWLGGDITVKRWIVEDPFLQAGIREYQQGDPLNAINWKATARTQELQINKKDYTADHHLMIYVNFDSNEDIRMPIEQPKIVEKGLSYAASLANYTIEQGISTGFGCNGYYVEPFTNSTDRIKPSVRVAPSNSGQQIGYIFDAIAKVEMDRSRNFRAFLQEDVEQGLTKTDIIIFSLRRTEKMNRQIAYLEELGNAVEVVLLEEGKGGEADVS